MQTFYKTIGPYLVKLNYIQIVCCNNPSRLKSQRNLCKVSKDSCQRTFIHRGCICGTEARTNPGRHPLGNRWVSKM